MPLSGNCSGNYYRLFIFLSLLLLIVYSNSFNATWQLDDRPNILNNNPIQITELSFSQLIGSMHARPVSGLIYRPVACLSLAINWYFGQKSVFGYHLVNFAIHLLAAWSLFWTIKALFSTPRLFKVYAQHEVNFIAGLATLFWALNPIQTQAVTYIVQRMASMAALFALLALLMYIKARLADTSRKRIIFLLFAITAYLLAIFSKENAAALPLVLPFLELLFFKHTVNRALVLRGFLWFSLGLLVCILAGFALRPEGPDFIINYYVNRPFTLSERVLTETRILVFYLSQLAYPAPWRLSVEHDIVLSTSLFSPLSTLGAILFILSLLVVALFCSRKQPFLSFAIIFFFINHLSESTVVPLELIFEHRNYLPSMFLFVPLALGINYLLHHLQIKTAIRNLIVLTTTIVLILLGYATYLRNITWYTEESLWFDAYQKAPNSSRPLANLAIRLAWGDNPSEDKYRKALALTEKTLTMRMARTRLDAAQLGNMASILTKLGEHRKAIDYYTKGLTIAPEDANIRFNLAKTYFAVGDFINAEKELQRLLEKGLVHADYFNLLSLVLMWQNKAENALAASQKAFKLAPKRPDVMMTLGKSLSLLGHYQHAERFLNMARKNGGEDPVISLCLIENSLLNHDAGLAYGYFLHALRQHTLPKLIGYLEFGDTRKIDKKSQNIFTVPINAEILKPYLQNQLLVFSQQKVELFTQ